MIQCVNIFVQARLPISACITAYSHASPSRGMHTGKLDGANDTSWSYTGISFHKSQPITGQPDDPDCSRKLVILTFLSLSANIDLLALTTTFSPTPKINSLLITFLAFRLYIFLFFFCSIRNDIGRLAWHYMAGSSTTWPTFSPVTYIHSQLV